MDTSHILPRFFSLIHGPRLDRYTDQCHHSIQHQEILSPTPLPDDTCFSTDEYQRSYLRNLATTPPCVLTTMSGRLLSARLLPLAQRVNRQGARHFHQASTSAGGLLRSDSTVRLARQRIWPAGYTPFHNAVIVRNASFARILPKLLIKFARIPALFAGATITGLAYVQYQATRMSSSVGKLNLY